MTTSRVYNLMHLTRLIHYFYDPCTTNLLKNILLMILNIIVFLALYYFMQLYKCYETVSIWVIKLPKVSDTK